VQPVRVLFIFFSFSIVDNRVVGLAVFSLLVEPQALSFAL